MHGFASATTVQEIAEQSLTSPRPLVALYVGDWDPSGLYMSEHDLPERLGQYRARFLAQAPGDDDIVIGRFLDAAPEIARVALTEGDVADPGLPSFALETKRGDPRHGWYRESGFGPRCWELDALSPVILRERVEVAIVARLDRAAWDRYVEAERLEQESIATAVRAWGGLAVEPAG